MEILGRTPKPLQLQFAGSSCVFSVRPVVIKGLTSDLNVSGPFLSKHNIDQLHSKGCLSIGGEEVPLIRPEAEQSSQQVELYTVQHVIVPPHASMAFPVKKAFVKSGGRPQLAEEGVIVGDRAFMKKTRLVPQKATVLPCTQRGFLAVSALNVTSKPIHIAPGTFYGYWNSYEDLPDAPAAQINEICQSYLGSEAALLNNLSASPEALLPGNRQPHSKRKRSLRSQQPRTPLIHQAAKVRVL